MTPVKQARPVQQGVIRKRTLRHPRHAQRTTGTRWGMQRRMFGWLRYAPNMSALAVNVREGTQIGAHEQGVEHSPTTNPSW